MRSEGIAGVVSPIPAHEPLEWGTEQYDRGVGSKGGGQKGHPLRMSNVYALLGKKKGGAGY